MVYVRWYGKVVEGTVVKENDLFGMTAVKIPVQGVTATALFMPGHVYQTEGEAGGALRKNAGSGGNKIAESVPKIAESVPKIAESVPKMDENVPKLSPEEYIAKVYVNDLVQRFKKENWDEERNHLRTDKLDEFYELWKKVMTPVGHAEATPAADAAGTVAGIAGTVATPAAEPQGARTVVETTETVRVEAVPRNETALKPQRVKKLKPIKATQLSLFD